MSCGRLRGLVYDSLCADQGGEGQGLFLAHQRRHVLNFAQPDWTFIPKDASLWTGRFGPWRAGMVDPEIAAEGGRLLAAAVAGILEDASAYAADEAADPIAAKAMRLQAIATDVRTLAAAMQILST